MELVRHKHGLDKNKKSRKTKVRKISSVKSFRKNIKRNFNDRWKFFGLSVSATKYETDTSPTKQEIKNVVRKRENFKHGKFPEKFQVKLQRSVEIS